MPRNIAKEYSKEDMSAEELIKAEHYRRDKMAMIGGKMTKDAFKKKWQEYIDAKKKKAWTVKAKKIEE